jgi:hypothetical protein
MHVIDAEENQFLAVGGSGAFREGRIVQINRGGLIFIEDVATKRKFVFTFDRLAGYEGQSAAEVGLPPASGCVLSREKMRLSMRRSLMMETIQLY